VQWARPAACSALSCWCSSAVGCGGIVIVVVVSAVHLRGRAKQVVRPAAVSLLPRVTRLLSGPEKVVYATKTSGHSGALVT
jgi:hypothetical protein